MELLVRRAGRALCELLHPVTREARVRVAVDEPRDRAETAAVDLLDLSSEGRQVTHTADSLDRLTRTEDVRMLDHVHLAERAAAQRRRSARGTRNLGEVADEEAALAARGAHSWSRCGIGASRPCDSAAVSASG